MAGDQTPERIISAPERPEPITFASVIMTPGSRLELTVSPESPGETQLLWLDFVVTAAGAPIADLRADIFRPKAPGELPIAPNPQPSTTSATSPSMWFFYQLDHAGTQEAAAAESPTVKTAWKDFMTQPTDARLQTAAEIFGRSHIVRAGSPFVDDAPWADSYLPEKDQKMIAKLEERSRALRANLKPPAWTDSMAEGGLPGSRFSGFRDATHGVQPIPRGVPALLNGGTTFKLGSPTTSGRADLGNWMATSPLVARTLVNRLWETYFPRPLVPWAAFRGEADPPLTEMKALDAMAARLVAQQPLQALAKDMLRTTAFKADWTNTANPTRAVWQPRPLSEQEIRDGLIALSGKMDPTLKGPSIRALDHSFRSLMTWRQPGEAGIKLTPETLKALCAHVATRIETEAGTNSGDRIRWFYRNWLGRLPTETELGDSLRALHETGETLTTWLQKKLGTEVVSVIE
jgi:hypothetical protein